MPGILSLRLGEPDLIIASVPIDIPAGGNDLWHKHYVPDTGLTRSALH